jgi:hypothetical protein
VADVIQTELVVDVRGAQYTFRIPSIRYEIEVAARAASIRRKADPEGASPYEVGNAAVRLSYALAQMELYLVAATVTWPFSAGADGKPVVKHDAFPTRNAPLVYAIGEAFEAAYNKFLAAGSADDDGAGAETVASS